MPELDPLGATVPAPSDPADLPRWLRTLSLSAPPIIEVTSTTAANNLRTAYRNACLAAGVTAKRLMVWNTQNDNLERDTGTGWEYVAGRQHGATVAFGRVDVAENIVLSLYATEFVRASAGWTLADASDVVIPFTGILSASALVVVQGGAASLGRSFVEFILNDEARMARQGATNEDIWSISSIMHVQKGWRFKVRVYHAGGGTRQVAATVQLAAVNSPNYV